MDSLNPQLHPACRPLIGRYFTPTLEAYRPLRLALGYEPFWFAVPDPSNATLPIGGRFEARISVRPQSYVWALSTYSEQLAGFTVQIYDLGTQAPWFSAPLRHTLLGGDYTSPEGIRFPLHILPAPRLVLEPGQLSVQLANAAAVANQVQLLMLISEPGLPPQPRNQWNDELDKEAALARRAIRGLVVGMPPAAAAAGQATGAGAGALLDPLSAPCVPLSIDISTAGDNVTIPGIQGYRIGIYALDLQATSDVIVKLLNGAKALRGPITMSPALGYMRDISGPKEPHWVLDDGASFVLNFSAGVQVTGDLQYRMLQHWGV